MTIENLNQYRDQCLELERIAKTIAAEQEHMHRITVDSVRGSMIDYPYIQRTVLIHGVDERHVAATKKRIELMVQNKERLSAECLEIEQWIAGLDDSKLRQIIELRFIKGYGWKRVARIVYGSPRSESAVRMRVERFLEKIS